MTTVCLDSSCLIYLVEGADLLRERIARRLDEVLADPLGKLLASRLARMECRVKPLRVGDAALLTEYEAVFGAARFVLVDVTASILDRAADLRPPRGSIASRSCS